MVNTLNAFHIEVQCYERYMHIEQALYRELKSSFKNCSDYRHLYGLFGDILEVEQHIREFRDEFRGLPPEEVVKRTGGQILWQILDYTHRPEFLSYICAVELLLTRVMDEGHTDDTVVIDLMRLLNQYIYRGDPVPSYFNWNFPSSTYQ